MFVLPGSSLGAAEARIGTLKQLVRDAGLKLWAADLLSFSAAAVTRIWEGDTAEGLVAEAERKCTRPADRNKIAASYLYFSISAIRSTKKNLVGLNDRLFFDHEVSHIQRINAGGVEAAYCIAWSANQRIAE